MTEYRSKHKGKTIDDTVDTVINHDAVIKYGNIEGLLSNQTDLYGAIDNKVNKTTTVNGKTLNQNITLTAADVGALPTSTPLASSLEVTDLTISLKDQNNNVLSAQNIPTYNKTTLDGMLANKANTDLDNLTVTGEAHFANPDLSNLSFEGQNRFTNKDFTNLSGVAEDHFKKPPVNCIISGNTNYEGSLDLIDANLYAATNKEYTQPGTYEWVADTTGSYTVALSGAGGGGARNTTDNTHGFWCSGGSAGSGAMWKGTVQIRQNDNVKIIVGSGGSDVATVIYSYGTTGGAGGATILYINNTEVIRCGGGGGGSCGGNAGGGQVTISQPSLVTTADQANGNRGSYRQEAAVPNIPRTVAPYDGTNVGPGSGGGSYSSGYAGVATVSLEVEGSEEVRYKVNPEHPLVIADANANKITLTSVNPDIVTDLPNGEYNKFVGADGSELLNGYIFKGIESPAYWYSTTTASLNIQNNIVSGFADQVVISGDKVLPFSEANSWNITVRTRYIEDSTRTQILMAENTGLFQTRVGVDAAGKLGWQISSDQNSGNINAWAVGSTVLTSNNIYFIRFEYTGSSYRLLLSTTGDFSGEETAVLEKASTVRLQDLAWLFGGPFYSNTGMYWAGTIDLNQTYVIVNGRAYERFTPSYGDVWIKGGNPAKTYKFGYSNWEEYDKVYIGSFTISNGNLSYIKNSYLCCNNADVSGQNTPFIVESHKNAYSWYRLWNNGWLEQGGPYISKGADTWVTVSLLKQYKDDKYQVFKTLRSNNSFDLNANAIQVTNRTQSSFQTWDISGISGGQGFDWMAVGWAKDSVFSYNLQA